MCESEKRVSLGSGPLLTEGLCGLHRVRLYEHDEVDEK